MGMVYLQTAPNSFFEALFTEIRMQSAGYKTEPGVQTVFAKYVQQRRRKHPN
jgi:hypothetical protein